MIQVIRHDMDPNIYLNNSRKTPPVFSEKKGGKYQKIAKLNFLNSKFEKLSIQYFLLIFNL